jgi:hypothetical protein
MLPTAVEQQDIVTFKNFYVLFSVEMGTTDFYPSNSSLINNLHFWKS